MLPLSPYRDINEFYCFSHAPDIEKYIADEKAKGKQFAQIEFIVVMAL